MTQNRLKIISFMTVEELRNAVKGSTIDAVLRLRREVQEGMARRRKLVGTALDEVLDGALVATMVLERWAREAAYIKMMPDILRANQELLTKDKKAAKIVFNSIWENHVSRSNY